MCWSQICDSFQGLEVDLEALSPLQFHNRCQQDLATKTKFDSGTMLDRPESETQPQGTSGKRRKRKQKASDVPNCDASPQPSSAKKAKCDEAIGHARHGNVQCLGTSPIDSLRAVCPQTPGNVLGSSLQTSTSSVDYVASHSGTQQTFFLWSKYSA